MLKSKVSQIITEILTQYPRIRDRRPIGYEFPACTIFT